MVNLSQWVNSFLAYQFGLCLGLRKAEDVGLKQEVKGWLINRVLDTRFSSGRHVEKNAKSEVIKTLKSSILDSIYKP